VTGAGFTIDGAETSQQLALPLSNVFATPTKSWSEGICAGNQLSANEHTSSNLNILQASRVSKATEECPFFKDLFW
jgi:hypothetical protein